MIVTLEYNCKIFGCSCYFAISDDGQWNQDPLTFIHDIMSGKAEAEKLVKMNSTKDVLLSLFRSRDDNLIWVASTLVNRILKSSSQKNLVSTRIIDTERQNSPLFMIIGFIHGLLGTESEFRLTTVRSLGNLLQNLAKFSGLSVEKLPQHLLIEFSRQANNRIEYLLKMVNNKQNLNILLKMFNAALQNYE